MKPDGQSLGLACNSLYWDSYYMTIDEESTIVLKRCFIKAWGSWAEERGAKSWAGQWNLLSEAIMRISFRQTDSQSLLNLKEIYCCISQPWQWCEIYLNSLIIWPIVNKYNTWIKRIQTLTLEGRAETLNVWWPFMTEKLLSEKQQQHQFRPLPETYFTDSDTSL